MAKILDELKKEVDMPEQEENNEQEEETQEEPKGLMARRQ